MDYPHLTKKRIITDIVPYIVAIYVEIRMAIFAINGNNDTKYIIVNLIAILVGIQVFSVTKGVIKLTKEEKQTKSYMKILLYLNIILGIAYLITTCILTVISILYKFNICEKL